VRRDLGDFQTPPELAAAILDSLGPVGSRWPRVLEPTCGRGHFIAALLAHADPPREIQAIEIQEAYCRSARALAREVVEGAPGVRVRIKHRDLFEMNLARDLAWTTQGPLLVIGNPPWVTSAELGRLKRTAGPPRRNVKGLPGLAARTGDSNFDVAEAIWLKLIAELAGQAATIVLLSKTSVARSVLQFAHRAGLPIAEASIRRISAPDWFGAAVDACCFAVTLGPVNPNLTVPVFADLTRTRPDALMGFCRGWLLADRRAYRAWSFADGVCPLSWRQGIKHDAAAVMELARQSGSSQWQNKLGDVVDVEPEFIYPLLKARDLNPARQDRPDRAVLVPQERIGDETAHLAATAPRLWRYLQSHAGAFNRRKSSIYRGQPQFALFGIGPYSFAPFKVAISGMHKQPRFQLVGSLGGRPVMLDDTCYFLPCSTAAEAAALAALCNDPIALGFLSAASFRGAKRPITKTLLQRLDLLAILKRTDRRALTARAIATLNQHSPAQVTAEVADVIERFEQRLSTRP
jgi:hypothetical protein